MSPGQSPGPTLVRSNYHGPLAQPGVSSAPSLPLTPQYPAEFPTSALTGVFLLIPVVCLQQKHRSLLFLRSEDERIRTAPEEHAVLYFSRQQRCRCSPAAGKGVTFQAPRTHRTAANAPSKHPNAIVRPGSQTQMTPPPKDQI